MTAPLPRLRAVIDGRLDALAIEGLEAIIAEVRGATLAIGPIPSAVVDPTPPPTAPTGQADDDLAFLTALVAFETGVAVARIRGQRRRKAEVRARTAVIWAAHELTDLSLLAIGRFLGGRDHSTVISAVRRAARMLERDPAFQRLADKLKLAWERRS